MRAKTCFVIAMAIVFNFLLPVSSFATVSVETEGVILGGFDGVEEKDDVILGGVDGMAEPDSVFAPGGWGMKADSVHAPGGWGLWWRGVKQSLSLTFTFNAEKKAEKRLRYAEENMQMANVLRSNPDDAKAQKRAEKLTKRAVKYMDKLQSNEDIPMPIRDRLQNLRNYTEGATASGLPSGKRQIIDIEVTPELDGAAASGLPSGKRQIMP